jgi:hypothetical protein
VYSRGETEKNILQEEILKEFFAGVKQNLPTLQGVTTYLA